MFKKSLASLVSAAVLVAGPGQLALTAAAQTMTRGPVTGPTVTPTIAAGLNSPVPGAASFNIPTVPPGALTAPGLPAAPVIAAPALDAAVSPEAGAAVPVVAVPQRVAVKVVVPAEVTEQFTADQKSVLDSVIALMKEKKRLFTWDQVTVRLPDSIFDGASKPIINVGDLFSAPQANELERLAIRYGKLSAEQHAQLRKDGTFDVPSADFPGQTHVWKASGLLQKGEVNIKASLRGDSADAASHYLVSLPRTIKGTQTVSLRSGARSFFEGLYETVGLAVGVPETQARVSAGAIERDRLESLAAAMRFYAPKKDLALYDLELAEKSAPIVRKLEKQADASWQAKAESVKEELSQKIKDPQALADALANAEQDEFYSALTSSAELETLHAGLGALLVNRGRAKRAIGAIHAADAKKVMFHGAIHEVQLRAVHPILSLIPSWLEARVEAARSAYAQTLIPSSQKSIAAALAKLGLAEELAAESAFATYWAPLGKYMSVVQTGSKNFRWDYRIWRRSNWTAEYDPETKRHSGSKIRTVVRSTESAFWRLSNLAQRALTTTNNMLYWLLSSNLTYGPLGFKSLFGATPFAYRWSFDREKGWWAQTAQRRGTLRTRISGFWAQRRAMLDAHEKKSSYAFFLGKTGERIVLFVTADLARGVIAPLIVLVFQPLLTLINTVVSLALTVATPLVIAPAYAAAVWALHALVFDSAGTLYSRWRASARQFGLIGLALAVAAAWYVAGYFGASLLSGYWLAGLVAMIAATGPLFPWVGTLIKKAGLYGAAAFIASVVKAVGHIVAGPVQAVFGGLRYVARTAYDAAMSRPLRRLARVPAASGYFVRRVEGPGLSSEYFFQVSPDLPLVAAWAALERSELTRYDGEMSALIAEPQKAYAEFAAVLDTLTSGSNPGRATSPSYKEIADKEAANKKTLSEAVSKRAELYAKLLQVPHAGKIKLAAPELVSVLKKTTVLAEGFYTKIMKDQGWSEAKIAAFWKNAGLAANDWVGVAKKTLSGIFGAEILVPLEDADKTLRIKVTAPGLADYVKGLEAGIVPGQLDNVSVGGLERPNTEPDVKSSVPRVDSGDLQGGLL